MDRKEMLAATLSGEDTKGICCGFWYHFNETQKFGEASIKAHIDFYNRVNPDILKIMNEHTFIIREEIKKPEDWKKVSHIPFNEWKNSALIEEFKAIKKELPNDLPLFATVHGVLVSAYHATETPGNFMNPDNMVSRHLREDPEAVSKGLEVIAESLIELCRAFSDAGADGIYYAALGGEEYRFSANIFTDYVKYFDNMVIEGIKDTGKISILHICKDKIRLPLYSGIDADIINWDIHDCIYGIDKGRAYFPGKTLLGGFDDRTGILVEGTEEEIVKETEEIVRKAGKKKLIIGADCTLPGNIESWRIRTVLKHAHQL